MERIPLHDEYAEPSEGDIAWVVLRNLVLVTLGHLLVQSSQYRIPVFEPAHSKNSRLETLAESNDSHIQTVPNVHIIPKKEGIHPGSYIRRNASRR